MTRAKHHLYLSYARKRFLFGKSLELKQSPFLQDIKKELLTRKKSTYKKKSKKDDFQRSLFE